MGTPDFAASVLDAIVKSGHDVAAVATQPDRLKDRKGGVCPTPVKEAAVKAGIAVMQPQKAASPEFIEKIRDINPDAIVVAAFGQILTKELLSIPKYGCLNVHASLLPKLRGAAPAQWAVINGDKESGVTIMQMDEGIDTGDILLAKKCRLDDKETGESLLNKLAELGGPLVLEALDLAQSGALNPKKQNDGESTYAGKLTKKAGRIDFEKDADEIERLVRGLIPWPCAFTRMRGKMLKIWEADVLTDERAAREGIDADVPAGTVAAVRKNDIVIKTGKGYLSVLSLQLEGKKRMEAAAFLRGCRLENGERLG